MRLWILVTAAVALAALIAGCASTRRADAPATVESVDLERYAGLWYQVARSPHWFQRREPALPEDAFAGIVDRLVERDFSREKIIRTSLQEQP